MKKLDFDDILLLALLLPLIFLLWLIVGSAIFSAFEGLK